ncbi:MAG: Fe3+-siderophores ABC transporter protein [Bdellovibrionaceae bacterium]|nr:Fe3+-siderophores ABC transporter protein [Pseudobdellovibrionaceae bacterium]
MTDSIRTVSMVPSWTETLIAAGIPVIGRTRFCIEPSTQVKDIPIVGGTKDWDWSRIESLKPDLLVLDKDENPHFMGENHSVPWVATHVHDIHSCYQGLSQIYQTLKPRLTPNASTHLQNLIQRWQKVHQTPKASPNWTKIPGLITWVQQPKETIKNTFYIIWKNPWMIATRPTFIGDVADRLGFQLSSPPSEKKYPELDLTTLDPATTLLLFSSEPYPFHKKIDDIKQLGFPSAVVDGQAFSWFGVRSLVFLEKHLSLER